jgi:hypothetical protein
LGDPDNLSLKEAGEILGKAGRFVDGELTRLPAPLLQPDNQRCDNVHG